MTRINTNVSSLVAQRTLQRSNMDLQTSLTRLSTGLRINSGKDDPSGLIASEALRSDIGAIRSAIGNSERANQVITTADSALAQVSNLLNDIRGLVTEAANAGGMSADQIAANQLQIDQSLQALDQISQTTSFQGLRLLDGSLDFNTTPGTNFNSTVTNLQIDQANLGTTGSVAVNVTVSAAATKAELTDTGGFTAATQATAQLKFSPELNFDTTNFASSAAILFQATTPGASLEGKTITFVGQTGLGAGNETASYSSSTGTLTITVDATAATTADNIANAVNTQVAEFHADATAGAVTAVEALALNGTTTADFITVQAATAGPDMNNVAVRLVADGGTPVGTPTAAYDSGTKTLTVTVNNTGDTTLANMVTAINNVAEFSGSTASATAADEAINLSGGNLSDLSATGNTGTTGGGVLSGTGVVFELGGKDGSQVFNFKGGTTITDVQNAINLVSDATGVAATSSGTTLTLDSTAYGSSAFVDVGIIQDSTTSTAFTTGLSATRVAGTNIAAKVNGFDATGDGNKLSINTATLDLSLTVADGSSLAVGFTITGGGALFQLGPDVVSNQQVRLGIQSANSGRLGGSSGKLYQLGKGEAAALDADPNLGSKIVTEAINAVTGLRGRLGAFQKTSLDSNIASLNETLVNLTDAESAIRDTDFAVETAKLTRAQILVQSGTTVLGIANSNPQNVLALLRR